MKTTNDLPLTASGRNVPLGTLRMFLTLMVVAHHAVLAYHPYAPPPAQSLSGSLFWAAFPVVDARRWPGSDLFVAFNDTFFMSLMFLISGIFAWPSLVRKGSASFLRDRAIRLGVPFVVAAGFLAPLAYYPTYLSISNPEASFWSQWLSIGKWPAGPAWFLWVLLAFGCLAALVCAVAPSALEKAGRIAGKLGTRPIAFYATLVALSAIAYLPMAAAFTPIDWWGFGPFFVQSSRLLHYAVYFFTGMALGAFGLDRGLLAQDGKLARRWPLWIAASLATFVLAIATYLIVLSQLQKGGVSVALSTFGNFIFVLTCAASSFAFLAVFLRFARNAKRITGSLDANAYGIYLFHYACVTWLQFALLSRPLSGAAKGLFVFLGAVLASWAASALLGRIDAIGRILGNRRQSRTALSDDWQRMQRAA
jgi:hypothetical protein